MVTVLVLRLSAGSATAEGIVKPVVSTATLVEENPGNSGGRGPSAEREDAPYVPSKLPKLSTAVELLPASFSRQKPTGEFDTMALATSPVGKVNTVTMAASVFVVPALFVIVQE